MQKSQQSNCYKRSAQNSVIDLTGIITAVQTPQMDSSKQSIQMLLSVVDLNLTQKLQQKVQNPHDISLYITIGNDFFTRKSLGQAEGIPIIFQGQELSSILQKELEIIVNQSQNKQNSKIGSLNVKLDALINQKDSNDNEGGQWFNLKRDQFKTEDGDHHNYASEMNETIDDSSSCNTNFFSNTNFESNSKLQIKIKCSLATEQDLLDADKFKTESAGFINAKRAKNRNSICIENSMSVLDESQTENLPTLKSQKSDRLSLSIINNSNLKRPSAMKQSLQDQQKDAEEMNLMSTNRSLSKSFQKQEANLSSLYSQIKKQRKDKLLSESFVSTQSQSKPNSKTRPVIKHKVPTTSIKLGQSRINSTDRTPNRFKPNKQEQKQQIPANQRSASRSMDKKFKSNLTKNGGKDKSFDRGQPQVNILEVKVVELKPREKVEKIKKMIDNQIMPQVSQLQQNQFKTQAEKVRVLDNLELLIKKLCKLHAKNVPEQQAYTDIYNEIVLENNIQSNIIEESGKKLSEILNYLEQQIKDLNIQLSSSIDQNDSLNLKVLQENSDKQELIQLQSQYQQLEQKLFDIQINQISSSGNISDIKDEKLIDLTSNLEDEKMLEKTNIINNLELQRLQQQQLEQSSANLKLMTDFQITQNQIYNSQQEISLRENQLESIRKQKRQQLKNSRQKLIDQKTLIFNLNQQYSYYKKEISKISKQIIKYEDSINAIKNSKEITLNQSFQAAQSNPGQDIKAQRQGIQEKLRRIANEMLEILQPQITEDLFTIDQTSVDEIIVKFNDMKVQIKDLKFSELSEEDSIQLHTHLEKIKLFLENAQAQNESIAEFVLNQEQLIQQQAMEQLNQQGKIQALKYSINTYLLPEQNQTYQDITRDVRMIQVFEKEKECLLQKLQEKSSLLYQQQKRDVFQNDTIKKQNQHLLAHDLKIRLLAEKLEAKYKEKFTYRGNGDRKDNLDQFVIKYFKENKLYMIGETINVQTGLYILGCKGRAVKLKQAADKLMVQDEENKMVKIEKYLAKMNPEGYERIQIVQKDPNIDLKTLKDQVQGNKKHNFKSKSTNKSPIQAQSFRSEIREQSVTSSVMDKSPMRVTSNGISNFQRMGEKLKLNQTNGGQTDRNMSISLNFTEMSLLLGMNQNANQNSSNQPTLNDTGNVKKCQINL
ncbi:UNKNOWN [Stylonychia lemnae]|uniref:Uncharacterized protein n=1 Tax=Stylonychia lemnae TaxID=5949 RepID=A0A078A686_STYLE|nr:UNKNOWN [Stylonychia lemnae]|eukprot:CDW77770.1 UNKNOWN [Stylonychia lemnae]